MQAVITRECKYCGDPITLRPNDEGKWKPYNVSGGALHRCRQTYRKPYTTREAKRLDRDMDRAIERG